MKKLVLGLLFLGLSAKGFAQDVLFKEDLKPEEVPTVVVDAIAEDFPYFEIVEYDAIPVEYVVDDVYINKNAKDIDDYDTFQVKLKGNNGELVATYDSNGNLLNSAEHLKDTSLPLKVREAVAEEFPGWAFVKDSYQMNSYKDGKKRERYRIVLEKDGKKIRVHTDANGKILHNGVNL